MRASTSATTSGAGTFYLDSIQLNMAAAPTLDKLDPKVWPEFQFRSEKGKPLDAKEQQEQFRRFRAAVTPQAAAVEIDRYLGGKGELPANSDPLVANLRPTREEGLEGHPRAKPPRAEAVKRAKDNSEVTGCFERHAATCEAKRCLRCDLEEYAHEKV